MLIIFTLTFCQINESEVYSFLKKESKLIKNHGLKKHNTENQTNLFLEEFLKLCKENYDGSLCNNNSNSNNQAESFNHKKLKDLLVDRFIYAGISHEGFINGLNSILGNNDFRQSEEGKQLLELLVLAYEKSSKKRKFCCLPF